MFQMTQFLIMAGSPREAESRAKSQLQDLLNNSDFDYFFEGKDRLTTLSAEDSLFWKEIRKALRQTAKAIIEYKIANHHDMWKMYHYARLKMNMLCLGNYFINLEDWGPFISKEIRTSINKDPNRWWLVGVQLHS